MQGGFKTFFHFFYFVRFAAFVACFVSYIICLCYCAIVRVFLQLWLLFIDKDIARAYVVVVGRRRVRPCRGGSC